MVKVAILIDGGYFLKRLPMLRPDVDANSARSVVGALEELVRGHLHPLKKIHGASSARQLLYRSFYYDAKPYAQKAHLPVSRRALDYAKSPQFRFRENLFGLLRHRPNFAVRLGDVRRENRFWVLDEKKQRRILRGEMPAADVTDRDFAPAFRQKGVDMRIGLDIASITLKQQAGIIVLVSGDADFVPAAKLARREGVQFILDSLRQNVSADLFEHIDLLRCGFHPPPQFPATIGRFSPQLVRHD